MRYSRQSPTVNAGSMADIAFLLLIFFLVTTTIPNDTGMVRKLPEPCLEPPCSEKINERNVLRIKLNKNGDLMVENNLTSLSDLKQALMEFIDNNGDQTCTYCGGNGSKEASDNPQIAVVSLSSDRESTYKDFIAIQVELTKAYHELRENYVIKSLGKEISNLTEDELLQMREAYPFLISEAELK